MRTLFNPSSAIGKFFRGFAKNNLAAPPIRGTPERGFKGLAAPQAKGKRERGFKGVSKVASLGKPTLLVQKRVGPKSLLGPGVGL